MIYGNVSDVVVGSATAKVPTTIFNIFAMIVGGRLFKKRN
jgi:hypothetical protein